MIRFCDKEVWQDAVVDATRDIEIFSRYIAPELNIAVRFAGEEPFDKVTRQYNEEMKRTLYNYGIEFVEIQRIEEGNQPISASLVRKLLAEKRWDEIKKLVPEDTDQYLKKIATQIPHIENVTITEKYCNGIDK